MNKLNLTIGQKISVLKPNGLSPELYKGILKGFYYSKYAQYENALFIYIQRPRAKRVDRIIISTDTAFIFNGYFKDMFREELVSDNGKVRCSKLNKWTYEDVKNNKDLIYHHEFKGEYDVNTNIDSFIELTGDYLCNNDIKPLKAPESIGYINYIKDLISNYNVNNLMEHIKAEGFTILENCLNLAIEYKW